MSLTVHSTTPTSSPPRVAAGTSVRARAIVAAIVALVVAAVTTTIALWTAAGQRFDHEAMTTVESGREARLTALSMLGYVSITAVVVVVIGCVGLALARGQVRLALAAFAVIAGANITTQFLKDFVLERSTLTEGIFAHNSLPSGHTTVVAASLGALCLVSPTWLRPFVVAAGSCAVTLTGASTVVAGWHRPSDVIVAVLVSVLWTALASAVIGGRVRHGQASALAAIFGAAIAVVALIAVGVRPSAGWDAFATAALVLGSIALVTALAATTMDRISPSS